MSVVTENSFKAIGDSRHKHQDFEYIEQTITDLKGLHDMVEEQINSLDDVSLRKELSEKIKFNEDDLRKNLTSASTSERTDIFLSTLKKYDGAREQISIKSSEDLSRSLDDLASSFGKVKNLLKGNEEIVKNLPQLKESPLFASTEDRFKKDLSSGDLSDQIKTLSTYIGETEKAEKFLGMRLKKMDVTAGNVPFSKTSAVKKITRKIKIIWFSFLSEVLGSVIRFFSSFFEKTKQKHD